MCISCVSTSLGFKKESKRKTGGGGGSGAATTTSPMPMFRNDAAGAATASVMPCWIVCLHHFLFLLIVQLHIHPPLSFADPESNCKTKKLVFFLSRVFFFCPRPLPATFVSVSLFLRCAHRSIGFLFVFGSSALYLSHLSMSLDVSRTAASVFPPLPPFLLRLS